MASRTQSDQIGGRHSIPGAVIENDSVSQAPPKDSDSGSGTEWLSSDSRSAGHAVEGRARIIGGVWVQVAYALIDVLCVLVSGTVAFLLRFAPSDLRHLFVSGHLVVTVDQPVVRYGAFLLLYTALILLFCEQQDLYRTPRERRSSEETFAVIRAVSFATLLLTAFIYLSGVKIVSRIVVLLSLILNVFALAAWRYAKRRLVIHRVERGIGSRNALIIGAGRVGQALAHQLEENRLLGYRFKGFLDGNHSNDPRTLGKIDDLARVVRAEFIDDLFITIPSERELVKRIAAEAREYRLDVKVIPELYDGLGWHAPMRHVGDFPVMDLHWQPVPSLRLFVKRVFDVVLSTVGIVITLPVLALGIIWIILDSPGPVFYRSQRAGQKGRMFICYKLRTMVANADELKETLRARNERQGPFFKIADDPRVTRAGRFLRKYSFDELPQLWNVFKGDMSLVGPRPHPVDDYEQYGLDDLRRLEMKPGITGLWQVTARQDPSFETSLELDTLYIKTWSLLLDIRIIVKTIPALLRAEGS